MFARKPSRKKKKKINDIGAGSTSPVTIGTWYTFPNGIIWILYNGNVENGNKKKVNYDEN